ncbi:MAG: response regulator [Nitrospinota bacterium]|nr:MAG: response regulator [Nitrospinota bacterium]
MRVKRRDLTTGEIARYCQVTHFTVTNWINAGKLRAYRTPGGHHRVRPEDFIDFLITYRLPIPEEFALHSIPRILVVDDDAEVAAALSQALRQAGYQVETAADGYEAGLKMATFKPDLLVLDLIMPRINGFELCTRVKEDPATQHVKIIAMTGYVEENNVDKALASGADACLTKPFRPEQLLHEIHRFFPPEPHVYGKSQGLERRKVRRASLSLPVHYAVHAPQQKGEDQITGEGRTMNIGYGGLMLETDTLLLPSHLLTMDIYFPHRTEPVSIEGEVRWMQQGAEAKHLVGIRFLSISERARAVLAQELSQAEQR